MPKCDLQSNFIEITLRHECSPVYLLHILRTPFYKNTSGGLLLIYEHLLLLHNPEALLDPCQTSTMELFPTIINGF